MPPPNARPFAQMTLLATSSSGGSSSTWTRNGTLRQAANVATVAYRNEGVPPRRLDVRSARSATAPVSPHEPMLMYQREPSPEAVPERRPAEVDRARPAAAQQLERALRLLRDAVGADRVAPGAERQDRELGPGRAARGQAVHDLVDGAVAAERRDQLASVCRGGRARQLDGVPRAPP